MLPHTCPRPVRSTLVSISEMFGVTSRRTNTMIFISQVWRACHHQRQCLQWQYAKWQSGNTESGNTESGNTESGNTESGLTVTSPGVFTLPLPAAVATYWCYLLRHTITVKDIAPSPLSLHHCLSASLSLYATVSLRHCLSFTDLSRML